MSLKAIQTPKEIASKLAHQIPEYVIQEREDYLTKYAFEKIFKFSVDFLAGPVV